MDPITQQTVLAAAGAAGGEKVYVDDVFSTYLYDGTGSAQTITNGIDISGEGGLVWIKRRSGADPHNLYDTERGVGKILKSDRSNSESTTSNGLTSFNSNGFTLGTDSDGEGSNPSGEDLVAWTFRKAPGFFDVVTYTGNGVAGRSVAHNLGSKPGMILVKRTDGTADWIVYHRSIGYEGFLVLNSTNEEYQYSNRWHAEPDANNFYVGSGYNLNNNNNETYVAYIFAHDDAQYGTDGDESIIKCGNYTGTASTGNFVNLGFEPQWVMLKSTSSGNAQPWFMVDNIRLHEDKQYYFFANDSQAENDFKILTFNSTGFSIEATGDGVNKNNSNYIYIAIRRSHKPPEAGTDVFAIDTRSGTSPNPPTYNSGFPVDVVWSRDTTSSNWQVKSRLTGDGQILKLNSSDAEYTNQSGRVTFDRMDGIGTDTGVDSANYSWMFKRAQGCMDVVAYDGSSSSQNISHNLGVAPEFLIVKRRQAEDWTCYHSILGNTKYITLNDGAAAGTLSTGWANTSPTSTVFTVGTHSRTNGSSFTYIAYLFATLPGISKVGGYTGNGGAQTIDCGFTNGARFVLIKQTDATNDWRLFDTLRGIGVGNDPVLSLNTTAGQDPNKDWLEADSSGFKVNTSNDNVNGNNNSYMFLAIA